MAFFEGESPIHIPSAYWRNGVRHGCQVRQVRDVMHRWTPLLHQATGDIVSPSRSCPIASGCISASA